MHFLNFRLMKRKHCIKNMNITIEASDILSLKDNETNLGHDSLIQWEIKNILEKKQTMGDLKTFVQHFHNLNLTRYGSKYNT